MTKTKRFVRLKGSKSKCGYTIDTKNGSQYIKKETDLYIKTKKGLKRLGRIVDESDSHKYYELYVGDKRIIKYVSAENAERAKKHAEGLFPKGTTVEIREKSYHGT